MQELFRTSAKMLLSTAVMVSAFAGCASTQPNSEPVQPAVRDIGHTCYYQFRDATVMHKLTQEVIDKSESSITFSETFDDRFSTHLVLENGGWASYSRWPGTSRRQVWFDPPLLLFKLPLREGDTWSQDEVMVRQIRHGAIDFSRASIFLSVRSSVKSWVDIDVPAGHFRALEIESKWLHNQTDSLGARKPIYSRWNTYVTPDSDCFVVKRT